MAPLEKQLKDLERLKDKGTITDDEYQSRRSAIMSDPNAGQQGSRRGGIFKWGLLGCLGIFAVIGIIVVGAIALIAVALSGGSSSLSNLKDTHAAFAQGGSGEVETAGDVKNRVTIDGITDPVVSTNQFEQPQAGNHYITIALTIENVGERETTGMDVKLRTTDGTEYDQTFVSGVGASDLNTYQNLTSGGKTTAIVAFEVQDGSTIQWLKFDPNPFANGDLYFDAQ